MKKRYNFTKKDLILVIILAVTILVVDYSLRWHRVYKDYNLSNAVISKYIVEITPEEFKNYIEENHNTFVYVCVSDNEDCRNFEKGFRNIIRKHNLSDYIVYIDIKNVETRGFVSQFVSDANEFELSNINDIPVIFVFINNRIVEYIDYSNSNMRERDIVQLFEKYGIIVEND